MISDTYYNVLFATTTVFLVAIFVGSLAALVRGIRAKTAIGNWITTFVTTTLYLLFGGYVVVTNGFYPDLFAGALWIVVLGSILSVSSNFKLSDGMANIILGMNLLFWVLLLVVAFSS